MQAPCAVARAFFSTALFLHARKRAPTVLVCCAAMVASVSTARAGPWTREPGHGYAKLSASLYHADGFRDGRGQFFEGVDYLSFSPAAYVELGVLPGLHVEGYLPFVLGRNAFASDGSPGVRGVCTGGSLITSAERSSWGDAIVAVQATPGLLSLPHALTLQTKVPLYDVSQPGGPCGALFPQPGDGQLDVALLASVGDSFSAGAAFAYLELGHRHRTEIFLPQDFRRSFVDTLLLAGQVGLRYQDGGYLMLAARLELPYVADESTRGSFVLAPALVAPITRQLSLEVELGFTPWARHATSGQAARLFWTQAIAGLSTTF